jgi:hypothetical protein
MVKQILSGRLDGVLGSVRGSDSELDELANPWIAGAALLLLVALPLVPFLVVVWSISRTLKGVRKRVSWE